MEALIRKIESLRESEQKWRQWFEDAPISLWEQDYSEVKRRVDEIRDQGVGDLEAYFQSHPDLCRELAALVRVVDVNRFTLRLYKAKAREDLLSGITRVFSRVSYESFIANLMAVAERKAHFSTERVHVALDGEILHVQLHWAVAPGYEDTYGRVLASIEDITDRKRAEEAYSRLCNMARDLICVADIHTATFVRINPAFEEVLGYSKEELLGRPFLDFVHPEDVASTIAVIQDKLKEGVDVISFENRYRCKDGSYRHLDWNSHPKPEEGLTFAIAHDITERKRNEEALRESEKKYRIILETMEEGYHEVDLAGRFTFFNRSFQKILGYSSEELMGMSYRHYAADEIDRNKVLEAYNRVFRTGEPLQGFVWGIIRKDGQRRTIEVSASLIIEKNNQIIGFRGLVRDITDRIHTETDRERLQAQLAQSQKMESVGRLAGGVAHDFNNMLSVILGHAEMGLMQVDPGDPLRRRLEQIQETATRSADLVRQLLAFARKQTVAPKVLDLNDTVAGMLKMLRRIIGEDIDLAWMPGANLWPVRMDPAQIDQLLVNLCVNARDAIADVGKVTIETENRSFSLKDSKDRPGFLPGHYVLLAVSDNGAGMDKEVLDHLFEPFFTTKDLGKGTGLGLATVYGIVTQNEGFVNVYSEPDQGTTFRIYLPRHEEEESLEKGTDPIQAVIGGDETVLLVEDDPMLLEIGQGMLERLGYTVVSTGMPDEAIRLAGTHTGEIHLMITDVVMPTMNGKDLANRIAEIRPVMKTLFMSGYTANVIAHHGVLDEGVHFIQKPFSMKDLAAKVRETIDT